MKLIIRLTLRDLNSAPFYTNEPGVIAAHVAGWDGCTFLFRIFLVFRVNTHREEGTNGGCR